MRAAESGVERTTGQRGAWLATAGAALLVTSLAGPARGEAMSDPPRGESIAYTAEFGAGSMNSRPKSSLWARVTANRKVAEEPAARTRAAKKIANRQAPKAVERAAADDGLRPRRSLWARMQEGRQPAGEARVEPAATKLGVTSAGLSASEEAAESAEDVPESFVPTVADPLEPVNRVTFALNEGLDVAVFRPISFVYRTTVHGSVRLGISNAIHNFYSPVYFANDLLQGRPGRAGKTLMRFLINSTAGFGGLADAAAAGGLERHSEDFGQTLGVWGFGPGIYIVLPVIGPSTTRDGVGRIVDVGLNPATWLMWDLALPERLSPTMANAVSGHEEVMDEIDAIRKTSPDFYASMRDLYVQKRASDIANGAETLEPIEPEPNR